MTRSFKYKAFISYSHKDEKWAAWLHRALETYKVPKHLVGKATDYGPVPERIGPIFRDREELATSTELGGVLTEALKQSACLIVICSPNAAQSRWTNEEILTYKRLGRQDRIFCLIVDGEPNASLFEETAEFECFPEGLMFQMGPDGNLTDRRSEPIAADAREGKDNKQNAKLKLIAGMLGVGFDALKQREQQRRQKRMVIVTAAAIVGMVVTSGLATMAVLARNEANIQRRQAEIDAETARQTTDFMVSLFGVSDPSAARGNTITAREIMDQGADRIERELATQPVIQATLMETMGTVYTSLGLYEQAVTLLRSALDKRTELYGDEHLEVARTLDRLGEVLKLTADYATAENLNRQALAIRRNLLGERHPDVAESQAGLADVLSRQGEYAKAEPFLREALAVRRELLGPQHADIAQNLEDLGLNLFDQGDYDAPLPLLNESLAMRRSLLGNAPHPDLAEAINNLAFVLQERGEYGAAETLYREALEMKRRLYDDVHPEIALGLNNLAIVLHDNGQLDAAESAYREVLAMQREIYGADHPEIALALNNLATLLFHKGDPQSAIEVSRQSLEMRQRVLGEEHPAIARTLANLGAMLLHERRYDEAEPLLRQSIAMGSKLLGDDHPIVARSQVSLASLLTVTGRFEEARELAEQATATFTSLAPDHWRTVAATSVMGASLAGLRRFDEAESLLLDSYEAIRLNDKAPQIQVTGALSRIVTLYELWDRTEEMEKYRQLLAALHTE